MAGQGEIRLGLGVEAERARTRDGYMTDPSDRPTMKEPKTWQRKEVPIKPWTLSLLASALGPVDGRGGPRQNGTPKRRAAGYKQVIELMREGSSPETILLKLKMRPSRLRRIVASGSFRRMMEEDHKQTLPHVDAAQGQ